MKFTLLEDDPSYDDVASALIDCKTISLGMNTINIKFNSAVTLDSASLNYGIASVSAKFASSSNYYFNFIVENNCKNTFVYYTSISGFKKGSSYDF